MRHANLKECTRALELIRLGSWHEAHDIVENRTSKYARQIHAHLHRIEGDEWNARYWYNQAGVQPPNCSLEQEWLNLFDSISADLKVSNG